MRLTPALEFEKLRKDPESWNKIFLHKDGKFFRAYEWSAWLIKTVVCTEEMQKERGDQKMLTANRYVTKKGEYVSVGFPLESLAKFMIGFEDFDPNTVDDYAEFTLTTFDEESSNYEELLAAFEEWKHALPEKDTKQAQKGMPIGNLTSQLFSNVYLNVFDQFMKRTLKCRHYGRYVDDAYVVSTDKDWLLSLVPKIQQFLSTELGLTLHLGKLAVTNICYGVEFLGAFVKPYRTYASNDCLRRMERNIRNMHTNDADAVYRSVNSFLGVLCHHKTYHIRRAMFLKKKFMKVSTFNKDMTVFSKPTAQISL